MKLRILGIVIASSLALTALLFVGVQRQVEYIKLFNWASSTSSIDEYLGKEVELADGVCTNALAVVRTKLENSTAQKTASAALTAFEKTLVKGKVSEKTYKLLKTNEVAKKLDLELSDNANTIKPALKAILKFDPKQIQNDAISQASETALGAEILELTKRGITNGVSKDRWSTAFERKVRTACGQQVATETTKLAGTFDDDVDALTTILAKVPRDDWAESGFEKVSISVAYKDSTASCSGGWYQSCATFNIQTAYPCTVDLVVEFQDKYSNFDGRTEATVKTTKASQSKLATVKGGFASSAYYEVTEATCR